MKWEKIDDTMSRAQVHGGWLVREACSDESWETDVLALCFVPDKLHIWEINNDDD